jgi:hypothetical protein
LLQVFETFAKMINLNENLRELTKAMNRINTIITVRRDKIILKKIFEINFRSIFLSTVKKISTQNNVIKDQLILKLIRK